VTAPELSLHRLDNGLRVAIARRDELPLVAVNLWYHVGSKNERPGRTGFAHLFEHMLFQGSQHVGTNDHFAYVQQVGGVANGSTWYDRTNYYETLPSSHLALGLWLESDRMGFLLPAMTKEKLETQRSVVLNERRQRVDNQPYGRASERLHELLYPESHPYHWPVIGYQTDIEAASLEDVAAFFATYYHPGNAALTLVGNVDNGEALEQVNRYFGDLVAGPAPVRVSADLPTAHRPGTETLTDPLARLPRAYLAFAVPAYGERAWYAASVLSLILTGGKATRLYRDLVYRRELAQSVSAYALPTELCATFGVVITGRPESDPAHLADEAQAHLERIAREGPREDETQRAVDAVLTDYHTHLQSYEATADAITAGVVYFEDPLHAFGEHERYRAVSTSEVQAIATHFLGADRAARLEVRAGAQNGGAAAP
jgi:zinc protease